MKADLSRGHRPDEKRGRKYRRVLLQQGRLLLDSDFNALVDAGDTRLRDLARAMVCRAGSPDLGFLVTPGPLLALFRTLDGVMVDGPAAFRVHRDHAKMYLDRLPSLYIGATTSVGKATVSLRRAVSPDQYPTLRLWMRLAVGATLEVIVNSGSTTLQGKGADAFRAYDVPTGSSAVSQLAFTFGGVDPLNEAWIGLVEGGEPAQSAPRFWVAAGRFLLDGLDVEVRADTRYPDVSFPPIAGFKEGPFPGLASGDKLVAYIEGWERHVTRIEDPGIFEQALGGTTDTCTRTKAMGQVKLARCTIPAAAVPAAFGRITSGGGKLDVVAKQQGQTLDPCAVPEIGGYTGAENRLYRFEVHKGGAIGQAVIKWSRNNASDLIAAEIQPSRDTLSIAAGVDIRDGDLIELLTETIDLGDQAPALVSGSQGSFTPATRAVGPLFFARTIPNAAGQIRLLDLVTKTLAHVDAVTAQQPIAKVRRWDGLLDTKPVSGPPVAKFSIGDGIEVTLSGGTFAPGEYWQYEARKLLDNANGPWIAAPHGPERVAAPLALFTYQGPGAPLLLERWYDERFPELCSISADDVAYDGQSAEVPAWTVQQALDIILRRETAAAQESISAVFAKPGAEFNQRLTPGAAIPAERLANGLLLSGPPEVQLSGATEADCTVTLEVPYPQTDADADAWGGVEVGHQPFLLPGTVQPAAHSVTWRPTTAAAAWLREKLPQLIGRPMFNFYSSDHPGGPAWSVNTQHQLAYSHKTPPLQASAKETGAVAVARRPAATDQVMMRAYWTDFSYGMGQAGIVFDWLDSSNYAVVVYSAALNYGGSSGTGYTPYAARSLSAFRVTGGVASLLQHVPAPSFNLLSGSTPSHPSFTMLLGPDGVRLLIGKWGPFDVPPFTWSGVRASLSGQRFGVFTSAPIQFWEVSDGIQSLNPSTRARIRARVSLKRAAATFAGPGAGTRLAPFIPDFDTWLWLRVGWPVPYGAGYMGAKPYDYTFREEYPGIGAELIQ